MDTLYGKDLDWDDLFRMDFNVLFTSLGDAFLVVDLTSLEGAVLMVSDLACPKAGVSFEQLRCAGLFSTGTLRLHSSSTMASLAGRC